MDALFSQAELDGQLQQIDLFIPAPVPVSAGSLCIVVAPEASLRIHSVNVDPGQQAAQD